MKELLAQINYVLPTLGGWCSELKAATFVEQILKNDCQTLVEIGVWTGSSLVVQAMACREKGTGKVYGIDPWRQMDCLEDMKDAVNRDWWSKINMDSIYERCQNNVKTLGLEDYVVLIRDRSENVVETFLDSTIDCFHLDGNHSEEQSYKDARLWRPKIKSSGIVFFDDVGWTEGGEVSTALALNHFCEKYTLQIIEGWALLIGD